MRIWIMLAASCFGLAASSFTSAMAPSRPIGQAGQMAPRAVVDEVRRIIAKRYVLPERRPAIDAILASGLASGRYDVADPTELAERINADLTTAGRDRHLYFKLDPQQAAQVAGLQNADGPDRGAAERQALSTNFGVRELRVLPENIRYLAYEGTLLSGPKSLAALETAMRFLSGGQAIIIDLRANGGGSADAAQYILSHFLPAGQQLYTSYEDGVAEKAMTLATVPVGRMIGKPLYILTSPATASAAEEFAGNAGGFQIAQVVGEKTAGAGFMNDLVPIDGRFVLSVSIARVVLASTGRDWERTGISPTMPTPAAQALDAAQIHALGQLAARAPAKDRPRFEALAEGLSARIEARAPALPLAAYSGAFGERAIVAEAGRLYYQRGTRPRVMLIPLGGNRFAFDHSPGDHIEFVASENQARALVVRRPDKSVQGTYQRTS